MFFPQSNMVQAPQPFSPHRYPLVSRGGCRHFAHALRLAQGTLQFRTFHAEAVGPGISEEINATDFDGSYDVYGYERIFVDFSGC
jgi:hypothetical protein